MAEWGLTPEWIFDNWTREELALMSEKLAERKRREAEAIKGKVPAKKVSDAEIFNQLGNKIEVKKRGD